MANTVIIGSQWGDEGKGKIVDMLATDSDVIVRFQGGNNAGHTIEVVSAPSCTPSPPVFSTRKNSASSATVSFSIRTSS